MRNKEQDLKLLADAFYSHLHLESEGGRLGTIGIDGKRPFGNSDVESDILSIIGWENESKEEWFTKEQRNYARNLYQKDLIPYLRKNRI